MTNFKTIEEQLHSLFVSPLKYLSHLYDIQNNLPQHLTFLPHLTLYLSSAEKIVVFYKDNNNYYLLTFSIKECTPSPLKRILFNKGKENVRCSEITSVISNTKNNNQLCLYSRKTNTMAVIDDFLMIVESKNNQSITFQCDFFSKKDLVISIKYSPFDNYIGVLLSNNTLILFSVELMSQVFSYAIQTNSSVKDFSFFASNSNNWSSFSFLILNSNGEIDVVCPFFPLDFSISNQHIASLREINAKYSESLITKDLNNQIVEEIENSMKDIQKANHVVANDYLQNFNNKLLSKKITIVNKASSVKCEQYKNIFILNESSPFFILRVSESDSIDVLVLSGEIMPIRELKQSPAENMNTMRLYLIERIMLNNMNKGDFIVTKKNEDTFIMLSDNNVYKIEISYIRALEKLYEEREEEIELGYFKSDVSQILSAGDKQNYYVVPMMVMNTLMILNKENSMLKFLTVVKSSSKNKRKSEYNNINKNELSREIKEILIRFKKDFEACEEEKIIERKKKEKKDEEIDKEDDNNKKEFSFGGEPPIDTNKSNIMIKKNLFESKIKKPKVDKKKEEPKVVIVENKKPTVQEDKKLISNPFTIGQNNNLKGFEPSLPNTNQNEQPKAKSNPFEYKPTQKETTNILNPFNTQASQSQFSFNLFTTQQNEKKDNPFEKQNMQNPFASNSTKTQPSTNPFDINNYINPQKEQSIFINNPFPPANPPNFSHPEKSTSPPLSNILINSRPIEHYHLQPQESKILKKIEDEYENKRKFLSIKKEIYMEKIALLEHYGKEMNMIIKKLRSKSKICLKNIQSVSLIEKEIISKRERIKEKIKSLESNLKNIKLNEANKKINIENSNINEMLSSQLKQLQSKLSEIEDYYSTIKQNYEEILNNDSTSLFSDLSIPITSIGTELYSKYKYMVQSKNALMNEIETNYNKL